jgi:hypothetical protein
LDDEPSLTEIMKVEDRFQITGRGLLLIPEFPARHGRFPAQTIQVVIETPDGARMTATARIESQHFSYSDPIRAAEAGKSAWVLVARLPDGEKEDVPVGSRILAPREIAAALAALA